MKIIFNGIEVNFIGDNKPSTEFVPTPETAEFGMDVVVTHHSGVYQGVERYNNLTEVHLFYQSDKIMEIMPDSYDVAFESDIHGTGFTRRTKEIESIVITSATELAESI